MQAILENESSELPFPFIVDVRNIAEAHIAAAVTPSAKGRYLLSNANTVPNSQVVAFLEERFPGLQFQKAKQEQSKPVLVNDKVQGLWKSMLAPVKLCMHNHDYVCI